VLQSTLAHLDGEALVQLKLKQGRPHVMLDMRIVDEEGGELPWDGKAFGNLQAGSILVFTTGRGALKERGTPCSPAHPLFVLL
jgi:hypothetical protein